MNLSLKTTERIERAKMHVLRILEKECKAARDGQPRNTMLLLELAALRETASKDWSVWYQRVKALKCAAAERKDKGVVLFTVFVPDILMGELDEITVTPHRVVTRQLRKAWFSAKFNEPHTELRDAGETLEKRLKNIHEWAQRYDCPPEKAAELRRKEMPAWAKEAA